jgi:acyl carrier protein
MSQDQLLDKIQEILREVFEDPDLLINRATTADHVPGWDSLTHMTLIAEIENRFGVKFTFTEVSSINTLGDMADMIAKKIS